jgi:hypothetical protein
MLVYGSNANFSHEIRARSSAGASARSVHSRTKYPRAANIANHLFRDVYAAARFTS